MKNTKAKQKTTPKNTGYQDKKQQQRQKQKNRKKQQKQPMSNLKSQPSQMQNAQAQQMLKKALKTRKLTQAQQHLKDILMNKVLYKDAPLDQTIFKSSLVIKLKVPQKSYIKRNQKMQLGSILRKCPKTMLRSYEAAYEELYHDMQEKGDQIKRNNNDNNDHQFQIRNICSFQRMEQQFQDAFKKKRKVISQYQQEQIFHNCREMKTQYLDAFIISYNALIYSLQQLCGFKVRAFITSQTKDGYKSSKQYTFDQIIRQNVTVNRVIYILLYLPDQTLIKAANKYHIKKQIDYSQVDPFINEPMDLAERPLQLRFQDLKEAKIASSKSLTSKGSKVVAASLKHIGTQLIKNQQNRKDVKKSLDRKLGFLLPNNAKTEIINPVQLSNAQQEKFQLFRNQFDSQICKLIGKDFKVQYTKNQQPDEHNYFNDPKNQDSLTLEQKDYLFRVNRGKVNLGVEKKYVQIKKKRKYTQILKRLSEKYGYKTHDPQPTYVQFKLANKKSKFFSRLDKILLYKQLISSPYGQLQLFNTMERIKLSYLALKQHIRVQNFYMLDCKVFALGHDYQKSGKIGQRFGDLVYNKYSYQYQQPGKKIKQGINGGLNGQNLQSNWHRIFTWRTNFDIIRNYMGQSKAFLIFIKTRLIQLFLLLAPIGFALQFVKIIIIDPAASHSGYYPEFYFYIAYMAIITIVYGIFQQKYRRSEQNFIQSFVETAPNVQFIFNYRGPYMRDLVNDNANTYNEKFTSIKDGLMIWLSFTFIFLILGIQIGFYYLIRQLIVQLSFKIREIDTTFSFLRPVQLIGYSIYFIVNALLSVYVIPKLSNFLTQKQNRSTKETFTSSLMLKLFIFQLGVQMIPPIDLLYIQEAARTSCSSDWCAKELEAYVYSRYFFLIFYSLITGIQLLIKYLKLNGKIQNIEKVELNFSNRLSMFLSFVYKQSKKKSCEDLNLVDETVALMHFATFLTILPFAPALSLLNMLINYNIERTELLRTKQRPIPKLQIFKPYRKIVVAIGHWMLFYNFSRMFITLQWLQYLFQNVVLTVTTTPSQYTIMTLRYATIILFMFIYELLMKVVINIVNKNHSIMDKRKLNMYEKHQIRTLNLGNMIVLKRPKPINSISRTYHNIKNSTALENQNNQQIEGDQNQMEDNSQEFAQQPSKQLKRSGTK